MKLFGFITVPAAYTTEHAHTIAVSDYRKIREE